MNRNKASLPSTSNSKSQIIKWAEKGSVPSDSKRRLSLSPFPFFIGQWWWLCVCAEDRGSPWWLSCKESTCRCRRRRFDLQVRKIPWRRKWQPTSVFLPEESHGQRSLVGYRPWGRKELDTTERVNSNNLGAGGWVFREVLVEGLWIP